MDLIVRQSKTILHFFNIFLKNYKNSVLTTTVLTKAKPPAYKFYELSKIKLLSNTELKPLISMPRQIFTEMITI